MWKKTIASTLIFVVLCLPVAALGPDDVQSLRDLILFFNGSRAQEKVVQLNGEYYVPLSLLEREFGATYSVAGTLMRLEMDKNTRVIRVPSGGSTGGTNRGNTGGSGSSGGSPAVPETPPNAPYTPGTIRNDLRSVLDLLDQLEDLSTEFRAVIYAHVNNITQGKNTSTVERKLTRLHTEYENYWAARYYTMVAEIDKLNLSGRYDDDLVDDLHDDLDDVFASKQDALNRLKLWIDDKSEDTRLQVFESVDRAANRQITDVRNYVRGTLRALENQMDIWLDV